MRSGLLLPVYGVYGEEEGRTVGVERGAVLGAEDALGAVEAAGAGSAADAPGSTAEGASAAESAARLLGDGTESGGSESGGGSAKLGVLGATTVAGVAVSAVGRLRFEDVLVQRYQAKRPSSASKTNVTRARRDAAERAGAGSSGGGRNVVEGMKGVLAGVP